MILNDILTTATNILHKQPTDRTVNGIDMGLLALNAARREAELGYDYNFTRFLYQLVVDGVVGARIDDAIEYYTQAAISNKPKTIIDVGLFDTDGNLRPAEWTTVSESLQRMRSENPYDTIRYPTDAQATVPPSGMLRFVFTNRQVFFFPKTTTTSPGATFTIGFEAYAMTPDWGVADLTTAPEPWGTKAYTYLLWYSVIFLNQLWRDFVPRQEGNLPSPQDMMANALNALQVWDARQYETFRQRGR